ncbi:MAG: FAD-binding domain-containing protein [Pseudomonadota bacterium]
MHVVWFKRDLRVSDHRPLCAAVAASAEDGMPVLPLYMAEPGLWAQADTSGRHWAFIREGITELGDNLANLGQPLVIRIGEAVELLERLHHRHGITALWSHEETGNGWTYERDVQVAVFCQTASIPWHEFRQNGAIRRLKSRNRWASRWNAFMGETVLQPPEALRPVEGIDAGSVPDATDLGLKPDPCPGRQKGTKKQALDDLSSFFARRGKTYQRAMSSPVTGFDACSRMSAHLAWGTLSMREVVQTASRMRDQFLGHPPQERPIPIRAIDAMTARLHWHCHFIQKMETEPQLEFRTLHPYYDDARSDGNDPARLEAWSKGQTGFPMVDACMRALHATGWMNFRMRAMLMAFASYHLWLDWRLTAPVLARVFTDYEPGIHWSQSQMQSGTTGINTPRIYNPVKQGQDQDPNGVFIRRWLPELAGVADTFIHEPWRMDNSAQADAGCRIGSAYPEPIIDHKQAARAAKGRISEIRRRKGYWEIAQDIVERHASRKRPARGADWAPRKRTAKKEPANAQLALDI